MSLPLIRSSKVLAKSPIAEIEKGSGHQREWGYRMQGSHRSLQRSSLLNLQRMKTIRTLISEDIAKSKTVSNGTIFTKENFTANNNADPESEHDNNLQ